MPTIGPELGALLLFSTVATTAYADVSAPPAKTKGCAVKDRAGMIDALRLKCANLDDETWECRIARAVADALETCKPVEVHAPKGEAGPVTVTATRGKLWWMARFGPRAAGGERVVLELRGPND